MEHISFLFMLMMLMYREEAYTQLKKNAAAVGRVAASKEIGLEVNAD
jgi:hypothetical protein